MNSTQSSATLNSIFQPRGLVIVGNGTACSTTAGGYETARRLRNRRSVGARLLTLIGRYGNRASAASSAYDENYI